MLEKNYEKKHEKALKIIFFSLIGFYIIFEKFEISFLKLFV